MATSTMTNPKPATYLALECADCGAIAFTITQAEKHEVAAATDLDDPNHGGWDTIRIPLDKPVTFTTPTQGV